MRRPTPRATPVVSVPARSADAAPASSQEPASPRLLFAPVLVVSAQGERELEAGVLTIGRLPSSDIPLDDSLVSRCHARLSVLDNGQLAVEDLHSTNGVYVNGARLARGARHLRDGDRLLIGTSELSVFSVRPSQRRVREPESSRRQPGTVPAPRRAPEDPESALVSALPQSGTLPVSQDAAPPTERGDALEVMGTLATRLAMSGAVSDAVRVLSGHLNKVLLGASAGLPVSNPILERATHFGLELYRWTRNGAWIDYVLELHLASQRLPSEATVALLEAAFSVERPGFDRALFYYFVQNLELRRADMNVGEEARLRRLTQLAHAR